MLGLWAADNEGAKFWLQVMTDLQNRGAKDFFIACVDGLKGFPEAIETVYPQTEVQLCIVHLVRASLAYVNWKQRKEVAADLRLIYRAGTVAEAEARRDEFASKWDATYPMVSQIWLRNWERIIPFFAYPGEIRKVIYTTNTIESLNMSLRKIIKMRGSFPNEDAAMKLLYLALERIEEMDHAGAELERGLAAFCDSAGRPGSARRVSVAGRKLGCKRFASEESGHAGEVRRHARISQSLRKTPVVCCCL